MEIHTPQEHNEEENKPSTSLKVGVLLALIVLLIIGILLPIKLVPNAFSSFGTKISDFFNKTETATLSTNKTEIDNGVPFTLSWTGTHTTDGSYVLSYECKDNVRLVTSVNQPNETINCGSQYYFTPTANSIDLTPVSEDNRYMDITITLSFLKNGETAPKTLGSLLITIVNQNASGTTLTGSSTPITSAPAPTDQTTTPTYTATSTVTTPAPTPKPEPTPTPTPAPSKTTAPVTTVHHRISNPNGTANLSVAIISVGYINTYTNTFIASPSVHGNQRAAVKFIVTNTGDKNTGVWKFAANLPAPQSTYTSAYQMNLGPDDSIEYTLSFDNINSAYSNPFTVVVDPANTIVETTKNDNTASAIIINSDGNSSNTGGTYTTGGSDLSVASISTGIIDRNTNNYFPSNFVSSQDRVGVRFTVRNNGNTPTGQWRFTANLPTQSQNSQYVSDYQPSLAPGQSTTMTIGFDNLQNQGANTFSIQLDPYHETQDVNTGNNYSSVVITRN